MQVYRVKKESEAKKELDSATSVTVDQKSTIVTVGVTDRSPARAQELADAYMVALRATNGRLALSQVAQRAVFFEQQLAKEKEQLEDAEVELKRSEEQSGLVVPNGQAEVEMRSIAETQAQITARQVQLAAMRNSATESKNPKELFDWKARLPICNSSFRVCKRGQSGRIINTDVEGSRNSTRVRSEEDAK